MPALPPRLMGTEVLLEIEYRESKYINDIKYPVREVINTLTVKNVSMVFVHFALNHYV